MKILKAKTAAKLRECKAMLADAWEELYQQNKYE